MCLSLSSIEISTLKVEFIFQCICFTTYGNYLTSITAVYVDRHYHN